MSTENTEQQKETELRFRVSAAVIISDKPHYDSWKRKILLLQENRNGVRLWGPPGGRMKAHEDPLKTAEREVQEEIGCNVIITRLIGVYTIDRSDYLTGIGIVFEGQLPANQTITVNGEEGILKYRFFTLQGVRKLLQKGLIYRPHEYNRAVFNDFYGTSHTETSPSAIRSLKNREHFWI